MKTLMPWLILLCVVIAGCGESEPKPQSANPRGMMGTTGGAGGGPAAAGSADEFRFSCGEEHNSLDPQKMSWLHDLRVAECMFEPLVKVQLPELKMGPAAAEKWDVSDDGKTYTFHLRGDAKWSNGDPVLARDFVYAWRRVLLPDYAAKYAELMFRIDGAEAFYRWRGEQLKDFATKKGDADALLKETYERFDKTVGIKAVDDRTLQVRLVRATPYFLELAGFATFTPNHIASIEKSITLNKDTGSLQQDSSYWSEPEKLITNGPYKLAQRRFRQDLLMTQNEHYWNRAVMKNKAIREVIIKDIAPQLLAYHGGKVDWVPDVPSADSSAADLVKDLKSGKRKDVHAFALAGTYFYSFNCDTTFPDGKKNPLADARVRRALSMAIDRDTIVNEVTGVRQPVAKTFIPSGSIAGYDAPADAGVSYDPAAAAKLLDEAGYPGGKGLTGLTILYNTGMGHQSIAEEIKRAWEQKLGVKVSLEGIEGKAFSERYRKKNYAICRASWIGDYADPTTFLDKYIGDGANNDNGWKSAEYDALLGKAENEIDPKARMDLLRQAETIFLKDQSIAPIYHYVTIELYDPAKVTGLHPNPWNQRRLEFVEVKR